MYVFTRLNFFFYTGGLHALDKKSVRSDNYQLEILMMREERRKKGTEREREREGRVKGRREK